MSSVPRKTCTSPSTGAFKLSAIKPPQEPQMRRRGVRIVKPCFLLSYTIKPLKYQDSLPKIGKNVAM
jgi:hypothetical protein